MRLQPKNSKEKIVHRKIFIWVDAQNVIFMDMFVDFCNIYRGVLSKWDIFIKMRIAQSPPSLDLERSFYNKSILFLDKNHFLFYYLNLKTPVFTDFQNYAWLTTLLQDRKNSAHPPFHFCLLLCSKSHFVATGTLNGWENRNRQNCQNCATNYGI